MAIARPVLIFSCLFFSGCGDSQTPVRIRQSTTTEERPSSASQPLQQASKSDHSDNQKAPLTSTAATDSSDSDAKERQVPAEVGLSIDELLEKARAQAKEDQFKEAIQLVEQGLKQEPTHRESLLIHARLLNDRAFQLFDENQRHKGYLKFGRAADSMRKLAANYEELNQAETRAMIDALYNEACLYTVVEKTEKAVASLLAAFQAGFADFEQLESDEDLDSLRETPQFKTMIAKHLQEFYREELAQAESFPFDFRLQDLDGNPIALADLKGRLVIVDLWGTWCPPCRREIPHFIKLKRKYGSHGLEIVGLNFERVDEEKAVSVVQAFHEKNGLNYRCAIGTDEVIDKVPDADAFPTTLFIDRTGQMRLKVVGYHSLWELEAIVSLLLDNPASVSISK